MHLKKSRLRKPLEETTKKIRSERKFCGSFCSTHETPDQENPMGEMNDAPFAKFKCLQENQSNFCSGIEKEKHQQQIM